MMERNFNAYGRGPTWPVGMRLLPWLMALSVLLLVAGCAASPSRISEPRDPLEPLNRAVFRFNTDFDKAFAQPIARGYRAITPEPIDRGITNFFANLADVTSFVNNTLQFKMARAGSDVGRIFINTTVGILGFYDVATNVGLPSYKEDFGQTLGYWGLDSGAFLMLPILGPSSVRDGIGEAGDLFTDPLFHIGPLFEFDGEEHVYWGLVALRAVDRRANLLAASEILEEAALDPYVFLRDAYLQRRHALVHDGNPPDVEGDDFWDEIDFDDASGQATRD